jgi:hypothetical protein
MALALLGGCAKQVEYVDRVVEVKVPVAIQPAVKPVGRPRLPIKDLGSESTPGEVATAYKATVDVLNRHVSVLELQLKPFWNEWRAQQAE